MKDIHGLQVPAYIPKVGKKKQVKILYINADEDHVSLQFNKKKGDLRRDGYGRKINTIEAKLYGKKFLNTLIRSMMKNILKRYISWVMVLRGLKQE